MAFNVAGAVEVPLSTFGSLVTEMAPVDCPEGVSPDNQDVVYAPGSASSRPGLAHVFAAPFPAGGPSNFVPTVTYAKSFVLPNGAIKNLYFDSNGALWVEDFTNSPGAYTLLFTSTPGTYAKSITAFGREYIAISDGLHGQEVPLQYDGTNLDRVTQDGPGAPPAVANLALAGAPISSVTRNTAGVVTAVTTSAHNLQVGYQVQISGVAGTQVGSGCASIVIDNEDSPGIATITMNAAHGLVPGQFVQPYGINPVAVGGAITTIVRAGQVVTVTTTSAHNLSPGAQVTIQGVTTSSFNGSFTVLAVPTGQSFTYAQVDVNANDTTGATYLQWPVPGWTNFQVLSVPSPTSFLIQISYTDGTWTATGKVASNYNGTFYVASVLSSTSFTYQNPGPPTSSGSGRATPFGQAAPGVHQLQVSFLTRQGYITRPSPPVSFTANGGQYLSITNIPIGPSNVVARILEFTGAGGAYFFYIPTAPQVNGQVVGTATQINDNTTTSITLDFSDNTLFAALATSIPGNNLANQIVVEGALGFGYYGSRLLAYGQRNRIQNLLNLGFDGGWLASAPTLPLGWTATNTGGALAAGHIGKAWQISPTSSAQYGNLAQSMYQDAYGAPIAQPNTAYKLRAWLKPSAAVAALTLTVTISSVAASFSSTLTIAGNAMNVAGSFVEANFSLGMPASIPSDLTLSLYASASSGTPTLLIDELSIIYQQTPYLDTVLFGSYVNNPEAFDGVTAKFGPAGDTRKVMDFGVLRDTLYLLTQDPSGRLHETAQNGVTEPAGWQVSEVGANCGALSAFSVTRSQADDASASGGEESLAWASSSGARIFGGGEPSKISQEIQPDWTGDAKRGFLGLNFAAATAIWAVNDPVARVIYFGVPSLDAGSPATAPNRILPMNYRELDSAYQIAQSPPVHTSFSGKLIATDNTRKWTRWNLAINGAALMYRAAGQLAPVFFAGNGQAPGAAAGFGNVYTLNAALEADDDYGAIASYYTTYFFVNHEQEQALQLGSHRKTLCYLTAFISGSGDVTITPLINSLTNPWPLTAARTLAASPTADLEWTGGSATGQRMAFKIQAQSCS